MSTIRNLFQEAKEVHSTKYEEPCDHTMSHPEKVYGGVLYCLRCGQL